MFDIEDLTVIIPTYEREAHARRAIEYWHSLGVVLHVMDGSEKPMDLASLPKSERVHYHHARISMVERLNAATVLIDTPFCCLIGDDEFHLRSGLLACLRELVEDPDLVACLGRTLAFKSEGDRLLAMALYSGMAGKEVDGDTPRDRMMAHARDYLPSTIYAVTRTPVWQRAMRAATAEVFPVLAIAELQFEAAVAFQGKSKVIPMLSWLRNTGVPRTKEGDASLATRTRFHEWWLDADNSADKARLLNVMAVHLATDEHAATLDSVKRDFREAFSAYVDYIEERKKAYLANKKKACKAAALQKASKHVPRAHQPEAIAPTGFDIAAIFKRTTSAFLGLQIVPRTQIIERTTPQAPLPPARYVEFFEAAQSLAQEGVLVDMNDLHHAVNFMETSGQPKAVN